MQREKLYRFFNAVKGLVLGFLFLYAPFFHVLHAFERRSPSCKGKSYIVFFITAVRGLVLGFLFLYAPFFMYYTPLVGAPPSCKGRTTRERGRELPLSLEFLPLHSLSLFLFPSFKDVGSITL